jgi:L-ascorbate metabolism protein UlaG (beta-lactamase superfamily)
MKNLGTIDVAMLAKNIPYTMTDEQFIQAVKIIGAPIVYPVHYSELDRKALEKAVGPGVKLFYE